MVRSRSAKLLGCGQTLRLLLGWTSADASLLGSCYSSAQRKRNFRHRLRNSNFKKLMTVTKQTCFLDPEMSALHGLLSSIPVNLPFESLLISCQNLYEKFPPYSIEKEAANDIKRQQQERVRGREVVSRKPHLSYKQLFTKIVIYSAPVLIGVLVWRVIQSWSSRECVDIYWNKTNYYVIWLRVRNIWFIPIQWLLKFSDDQQIKLILDTQLQWLI